MFPCMLDAWQTGFAGKKDTFLHCEPDRLWAAAESNFPAFPNEVDNQRQRCQQRHLQWPKTVPPTAKGSGTQADRFNGCWSKWRFFSFGLDLARPVTTHFLMARAEFTQHCYGKSKTGCNMLANVSLRQVSVLLQKTKAGPKSTQAA